MSAQAASRGSAWTPGEPVEIVSGTLAKHFTGQVGIVIPPSGDDSRPGRARVAFGSTVVTVSDAYLVCADE